MMHGGSIHAIELVFLLLLLFIVVFAALARKLETPYPIVLVVAGLLLSFVPKMPKVSLHPDLIFLVVLPPLLYSAAWRMPWREFKFNLVSILLLAFGLVAFTVVAVAGTAEWAFRGFDWRLGFVLGAVVATTDAIAATSIAKRVGLPQRIVDILEGESLVNDATGLLALKFGIALVVSGVTPSLGGGLLEITYLTGAGLLLGLLVGVIVAWVHEQIDDSQIEITLSILVPYTVYLSAEAIHCSGVIAVIACGLYLGRRSSQFFSADVRMQAWAVWDSLTFILNGLVFVLIGLQLPFVLAGIREYSLRQLVLYGGMFSAILIALRLIWIFPGAFLATAIRERLLHQAMERPSSRQIFIVGWTGMRGVLGLAAAISLPESLADGTPFPQRNIIIFMTFCVILVTLVLQGLTLPALIRALGLAGTSGHQTEEELARKKMIEAALAVLKEGRERDGQEFAGVYEDLERRYRRRLIRITGQDYKEFGADPGAYERYVEVSRELLRAERLTAVQLRDEGQINDEVLRKVERELDLSERRLQLIQSGW